MATERGAAIVAQAQLHRRDAVGIRSRLKGKGSVG